MTERVDYYFGEDWDIEFTEWDDIKTARDTDVLVQNFVLLAAENTSDIVGEQVTATKISRHKRKLESAFRQRNSVSYFSVRDVSVDGREVSYRLVVGSEELEHTIFV